MRCVGKVTVHGEGAMLEGWKFAHGWSSYELAVCFQRTDRWRVAEMKDGYCWPPVKLTLAPTPTITARPSAVPSATASAKSKPPPKKAPAKKKPTSPRATEQ